MKSKNIRRWSLERFKDFAETHDKLSMFSEVFVRIRSKILFSTSLVGYIFTWCKKKSNVSSLNSDEPTEGVLSDIFGRREEFQVKSGKLKSPVISTLS
jgi:hypothetical protein